MAVGRIWPEGTAYLLLLGCFGVLAGILVEVFRAASWPRA
jgi:hypothetical protein